MSKATKDRLLDAAEILCAERGIDATSIRAITEAADANVAAVNFHFGGKAGLIKALFKRRVEPLAAARLERLEELKRQSRPMTINDVLDAFMIPLIEQMSRTDANTQAFARLFARTVVEPTDATTEMFGEDLAEYTQTFLSTLHEVLPHLDREEVILRFSFSLGSIAQALSDPTRRQPLALEAEQETIYTTLKAFLAAGFRAPATK